MRKESKPHGAWQWNPPPIEEIADEAFHAERDVPSATECTGLMPALPQNQSQDVSSASLYAIHSAKQKKKKR